MKSLNFLAMQPTLPAKPIWKESPTLDQLNAFCKNTIHDSLGIQFTMIGDDYLEASMPVDPRTKNPPGILHGGASVVLAESLGSVASALVAGIQSKTCVGIEINASHLSSITHGIVIGKATPLRLGQSIHVWNIQIRGISEGSESKPICSSRLTVMVRDRQHPKHETSRLESPI